jgi:membrane associated rhomboid family serine protease
MTTTTVGMRCPECAKERTRVVRMRALATRPQVTYALIAINVIAFIASGKLSLAGSGGANQVYLKGALLGSSEALGLAHQGVAHGQYWRILSSGFLHENLLHIGFNMYVLYVLGISLEPALGQFRFGVVYFVSLLAGSLGALLVSPHELTIGASGAVFGIMGAFAMELRARQVSIMQSGVGALILVNLVISFAVPGISWGGHVGGLIGGTLATIALQLGDRYRAKALGLAACVVLAVVSVAGAIATSSASEVQPAGVQGLSIAIP